MKQWDVFISHASEDKESVAIPLALALTKAGLRVWLDKQEIKLGDSIREKIDEGLAESSFGVVILSPSFLEKGWPKKELNGLMAIEGNGQKVILPIWHKIDKGQLTQYSPILADRLGADTINGIVSVANAIIDVVLYSGTDSPSIVSPSVSRRLIELLEDDPPLSKIKDFLGSHPRILKSTDKFSELEAPPNLGEFIPDFCINKIFGTAGRCELTLLVLGALSGPLVETGNTLAQDVLDTVAQLQSLIVQLPRERVIVMRNNFTDKFIEDLEDINYKGMIVTRRRDKLSDIEKNILWYYNTTHRQDEPPRSFNIHIRTYDWLIDTSISIDRIE